MTLLGLLVAVIVIALAFWAVQTICAAFNIPPQIRAVVLVLMVVIVVLWLLGGLTGLSVPIRLR